MPKTLSDAEITAELAGLAGWSLAGPAADAPAAIVRVEEFASFPVAIDAVGQIAQEAERLDHHPDIDIRWRTVTFRCWTHTENGVTELDLRLARRIEAVIESLRSADEAV
jgi:4a-hydroxytetrahydrobiopterin dehydratase